MITRLALTPIVVVLGIMASGKGCTVKSENHDLFTVKEISYQSWTHANGERGTDLTAIVIDADSLVQFESLTFRGLTVPVSALYEKEKIALKATIVTDHSLLEDNDYVSEEGPDRLTFRYMGKEYNWPVKNIIRLPSKFR